MALVIPDGYVQITNFLGGEGLAFPAACSIAMAMEAYPADPNLFAEACYDAFVDAFQVVLSTQINITGCRVKYGPNATGAFGEHDEITAGTAGGGAVPANTAVLIQKVTGAGGRSGRGRMFVPGIPEAGVNGDGRLDAGPLAAWQAAAAEYFTDMSALTVVTTDLVVLHDETSPVSTPTPIVSLNVSGRVATQRRRMRR